MSNKRINKAYVRYDGNGRVIAGSLILNRFKPQVGNWSEIPAYECCNPNPFPLRITFSNITEVGAIVGDVTDVANWNTYFDLPTNGNPFISVTVVGDEVQLFGGSNIVTKDSLFDQPDSLGTFLLSVIDEAGCIIELGYDTFGQDSNSGCENLLSVNFPNVITAGNLCFYNCTSLTTIQLPSLITAGNESFNSCTSLTTINLPSLTTSGISCFSQNSSLVTVNLPALLTANDNSFFNCDVLATINLPSLTTIGYGSFGSCISLTSISLPSCTNLGGTVGDDLVFVSISGNTITLTVPSALMTADAGNPDGDIQWLQLNNTVTVVTV